MASNELIAHAIVLKYQHAMPLYYAKKHVPSLKNVLLDGALEIDNNAAERKIKQLNH